MKQSLLFAGALFAASLSINAQQQSNSPSFSLDNVPQGSVSIVIRLAVD